MPVEEHGIEEAINENTSWRWKGILCDFDAVPIEPSAVTQLVATLTDETDMPVSPTMVDVNVLNTNGGILVEGGKFTFTPPVAWAQSIGTKRYQGRRLSLRVVYNVGELNHQVRFYIENLTQVP